MSVDIVVTRVPGDRAGADVVEGILSTVVIAILRGTMEIDDSEPVIVVTLSTNYRPGVRKGDIAEVLDELQGKTWRGRIVDINHNVQEADLWTDLDIEKPTRLYT